jgi:hypothetical protein
MLVAALVMGVMPGSASAASATYTAQSSGRGLQLALAGAGLGDDQLAARTADTDRTPGPNGDGTAECVVAANQKCASGPTAASILALPLPHNIINANLISQDAVVDNNGNSSACAGLVGPGGQIQLDDATKGCGDNTIDPATPAGVIINLATGIPLNLFRIRADAVVSQCTATAPNLLVDPVVPAKATGSTFLANAVLEYFNPLAGLGGSWQPILTLPGNVTTPNASILFPPGPFAALNQLVSLTANEQVATPGKVSVTALHLTLLGAIPGGGLLDVKIGQTSCGLNTAALVAATTTTTAGATTTTTAAPGTTTTTAPGATTTTVAGATTTTTVAGATTTTAPASTTSTTAGATTTTAAGATTSSTAGAAVTSTTPSTIASAGGSVTTKPKAAAPLANTGSNTRAELSLALGLIGLGFIVTGRGMQLGFSGPSRRRR